MSNDIAVPSIGLDAFGIQNARVATSLDLAKTENRKTILRCLQECDKRLTEEVGEILVITDYFIHDVECRNEKTGEVATAPRLVLIDKSFKTHECVSETLVGSLKNLCFVYGNPPWPDGLKLAVKMRRKGERSIYFFDPK